MLLGCIADDFTGATDLASMLVSRGMRTVQTIGIPRRELAGEPDAVVVALKSRNLPALDAVSQSLEALRWLQARGARQIYFKYCSTFDSTGGGNIGPVCDALLEALAAKFTVACPALPANRRTVYQGHLFVSDSLLSDSPMRHHPLTPMTDANLVRVLGRQTLHKVRLVSWSEVRRGAAAIAGVFANLSASGAKYVIVDAIDDDDLEAIGEACADLSLVTGGSGLAQGLPANYRRRGVLQAHEDAAALPHVHGTSAVLAGSCSEMTRRQVAMMARTHRVIELDPRDDGSPETLGPRT